MFFDEKATTILTLIALLWWMGVAAKIYSIGSDGHRDRPLGEENPI